MEEETTAKRSDTKLKHTSGRKRKTKSKVICNGGRPKRRFVRSIGRRRLQTRPIENKKPPDEESQLARNGRREKESLNPEKARNGRREKDNQDLKITRNGGTVKRINSRYRKVLKDMQNDDELN